MYISQSQRGIQLANRRILERLIPFATFARILAELIVVMWVGVAFMLVIKS